MIHSIHDKHIFLVGIMGVGKTSVGRKLAMLLDRPFCDTDQLIELRGHCTIGQIFATHGETAFRMAERDLIENFPQMPPSVVGCGGGLMAQPGLAELLKSKGTIVWLKASADVLAERLKDDSARPLLQDTQDRRKKLNDLLVMREPSYALANYTIYTNALKPEEVAAQIAARFLASSKA